MGCEFVTTSKQGEKVAIYLMEIQEEGVYVIVAIDYFTIIGLMGVIKKNI